MLQNVAKIGTGGGGSKTDGVNPYETKQHLADIVKKLDTIYVGVSSLNNQQQVFYNRICIYCTVLIVDQKTKKEPCDLMRQQ